MSDQGISQLPPITPDPAPLPPAEKELEKIDPSIMSQLINELQSAKLKGATDMPVRDIPRDTTRFTQDPVVQNDYVPPAQDSHDYIGAHTHIASTPQAEKAAFTDWIYAEFQVPIRLAILYFIFQLPIFKETLCRYAPYLAHADGQYNLNGYIFVSSLFGFLYFCWSRAIAKIAAHM